MPRPRLGGVTVLVIEDEESVLRAVVRQLREWGALVLAARDGREALRRARQCPDIVLADVDLGEGESGIDVARDVVAMVPTAKVLVCSGKGDVLLAEPTLPLGWRFLPKPFHQCDLCEVIGAILATNGAAKGEES